MKLNTFDKMGETMLRTNCEDIEKAIKKECQSEDCMIPFRDRY